MTVAVCVKCGAIKHGAFNACGVCGGRPLSEDELTYSLVMTDHYFSVDDLNGMSAAMLSGKPRPSLPPEQEAEFKEMLRKMEGGKLMKGIERRNRKAEGLT